MMRARTLGLLAIAAFFLTASSAAASQTHVYSTSFGSAGSGAGQMLLQAPGGQIPGSGVAVNSTTHDVYVADTGNHRVDEFDPSKPSGEQFVGAFGTEGSGPGELETPVFVAVDNSAGGKGDVYVGDTGDNVVSKFTESGVLIESWGVKGQVSETPTGEGGALVSFGPLVGIAVDAAGALDVLEAAEQEGTRRLFQFSQAGSYTGFVGTPRGSQPYGLTVDGAGELFKVNGNGSVEELSSSGADIGQVSPEEGEEGAFARGVTAGGSDLYVVDDGEVQHYALLEAGVVSESGGATCTVAPFAPCHASDSFGAGHLAGGSGVAVDPATGVVYVVDAATGKVDEFTLVVLPNVLTGAASEVSQTSATLAGSIDPEGAQVIACSFEYGLSTSYTGAGSGSGRCSTPLPFSANTAVPQTTALEGLRPNQTYHYRLSATSGAGAHYGGGAAYGEDQMFTTEPAVPAIDNESVSALTQTTATLNAGVNPNNQKTTYRFEYGAGSVLSVSEGEVGSGYGNVVLGSELSGLSPGTTYDYRVVATNATGSDPGPDRTFTTPPLQPPVVSTEAAQNIGQNTATLVGSVETQGFETTYEFDLGTDTSYGTRIFGDAGPVAGAQVFAVSLVGLTPGTTYHYRILATNTFGTVYGVDRTFTTASYPASILLAPVAPAFVPAPSATAPTSTVSVKPKPKAKPKPKKKKKKKNSKKRTASHGKGRK